MFTHYCNIDRGLRFNTLAFNLLIHLVVFSATLTLLTLRHLFQSLLELELDKFIMYNGRRQQVVCLPTYSIDNDKVLQNKVVTFKWNLMQSRGAKWTRLTRQVKLE